MKKILIIAISICCVGFTSAQSVTDALRYGTENIRGTARYRAMSGAFGALGGDLSAIQINPAGSAVFMKSSGSVTLSSARIINKSEYNTTANENNSLNLNFNQLGAVFVVKNNPKNSTLGKFTIGIAYDQTANHFDDFTALGNSTNSIDNLFLNDAQGIPLSLISLNSNETIDDLYSFLGENEGIEAQHAFLGHETFIIEANDLNNPNNTLYNSNITSGNFTQEYQYQSTGLNGKFSLNAGVQLHERFFLGVNMNSHFISFDETKTFFEQNNNTGSTINEVIYTNGLSTTGSGFSAQIGGIVKASEMLRFGIALETPTWYFINEETTQRLETFSNSDGRFLVNPNVINIFPEYQLRTPGKATASAALIFGSRGLISLDYSYKDYSSLKFSGSTDLGDLDFSFQNNAIDNSLQGVSSIRLGGEWRVYKWSIRGGLRYENSPYKDDSIVSDTSGFSLGGGYNFGKLKFDVAYDYLGQERTEQLYSNSGFPNTTNIDKYANNLTFTLGLSL